MFVLLVEWFAVRQAIAALGSDEPKVRIGHIDWNVLNWVNFIDEFQSVVDLK